MFLKKYKAVTAKQLKLNCCPLVKSLSLNLILNLMICGWSILCHFKNEILWLSHL